jgi:hypothetical protein
MSFVVYKGEKKIGDLVSRAYGDLTDEDRKRAIAALHAANPHFTAFRELKRGAALVVPALPGIKVAASEAAASERAKLETLRAEIDAYRARLAAAAEAERASIGDSLDLSRSKEVRKLAKEVPDVAPFLARARKGLEQRAADLEGVKKFSQRLEAAAGRLAAMSREPGGMD